MTEKLVSQLITTMRTADKAANVFEADRELYRRGEVPRNISSHQAALKEAQRREGAIRRRAAAAFGKSRGWESSCLWFGLAALMRGMTHRDEERLDYHQSVEQVRVWPHRLIDHAFYYRIGRRAAALAAHLYDFDEELRADCTDLAADYRLTFETPDFPSWWYPGRTTLVLYIGTAERAAR